MSRRIKKKIFAGAVCEQIVYTVSDRASNIAAAPPVLRFSTDEERAEFNRSISRRRHARKFNEAFSPTSLYSTLTFDDRHEVHTFKEARRLRDSFYNALRRRQIDVKLAIYMGRGENTDRIHFHMVSDGVTEEQIKALWKHGDVIRITKLREHNYYNKIDCGQDYTGLANYLFDHWTPEQGERSHRYKMTRNIKEPQPEEVKEVKRSYSESKPPRPPKGYVFTFCEATRYGYYCFHYVKLPPKKPTKRKTE